MTVELVAASIATTVGAAPEVVEFGNCQNSRGGHSLEYLREGGKLCESAHFSDGEACEFSRFQDNMFRYRRLLVIEREGIIFVSTWQGDPATAVAVLGKAAQAMLEYVRELRADRQNGYEELKKQIAELREMAAKVEGLEGAARDFYLNLAVAEPTAEWYEKLRGQYDDPDVLAWRQADDAACKFRQGVRSDELTHQELGHTGVPETPILRIGCGPLAPEWSAASETIKAKVTAYQKTLLRRVFADGEVSAKEIIAALASDREYFKYGKDDVLQKHVNPNVSLPCLWTVEELKEFARWVDVLPNGSYWSSVPKGELEKWANQLLT